LRRDQLFKAFSGRQTTPAEPQSTLFPMPTRPSPPDHAAELRDELRLAERVLREEAAAVLALADRLPAGFPDAVSLVCRCAEASGTVLVTGLGKSGLIGQKISATLASLGITSHFVHPSEAAHGDLGRFRPADLCIALSYSGETDEVVALASILKQDGVPVIAITKGASDSSHPSSLDRLATVPLGIGPCEAGSTSPAPTTSTTASLALGDALAICAAHRRNFTDDDFRKRHPGGALGELMKPVTDVLRFVVPTTLKPVPDDLPLREALKFSEALDRGSGLRRSGAMVLVNRQSGQLTGLFTDGDLRRLVENHGSDLPQVLGRPVREVMTKSPGTLPDSARVRDAVQMVREHRRDEIPVVDSQGRPVGVLDVQDLIALRLVKD
jgi:arabinose-5-phosphate isomerase